MIPLPSEQTNEHRVVLEFDDGVYIKKLIHPEGGCQPATVCANCGRDTRDSETAGCYDCKDGFGDECWVQGWVDNMTTDELLHGQVELRVLPEMADHETCQLVIIQEARS